MKKPLLIFVVLQILDFVTTAIALALGGTEQNPFVGQFIARTSMSGLLSSKFLVLALACAIVLIFHKQKVIRWANIAFTVIVAWNVTIIGLLILSFKSKTH